MRKLFHCGVFVLSTGLVLAHHASPCRAGSEDSGSAATENSPVEKLRLELGRIGALLSKTQDPAQIAAYNLQQAELLAHLINHSPSKEQAGLVRQMADCLGIAASNSPHGDATARERLARLVRQIEAQAPASDLAAYVTWVELQGDNPTRQTTPGEDFTKSQEQRHERLVEYVRSYPGSPDTENALLELGMLSEFLGQEADARKWYRQLSDNSAGTQIAFKAQGALRRLDLEGKFVFLDLPLLTSAPGTPPETLDIAKLRGKLVVIYFWASWDLKYKADFATLQSLLDRFGSQGLEVLCVNMDAKIDDARRSVQSGPAPGTQVYQEGGLEGTIATRYGLMALPTMLVLDRTGKVMQHNGEVTHVAGVLQPQLQHDDTNAVRQALHKDEGQ
jgi:hypothetical protein